MTDTPERQFADYVAPRPRVLSLCDKSGIMVQPWLDAGFPCTIVDLQHPAGSHTEGNLTTVGADVTKWLPPLDDYAIVFAFPPCTHLAQSGARWFKDKGLTKLIEGLTIVEACRQICEWVRAPWMLENPVGQLSTYWRKPDAYFDPCDFGGFFDPPVDQYRKKTCLWIGGGFVLPEHRPVEPVGNSPIHWAPPGEGRSDFRSLTPRGFAKAVFAANFGAARREAAA